MFKISLIGTVAVALLAGACAGSTALETAWVTPNANQPPMRKVVTVFVTDTVALRRTGEDKLAQDLAKVGVAATPAYAVLDEATAKQLENLEQPKPEMEGVKEKLRGMGYDGVVTMHIINRQAELEYSPGYGGYGGWGYPGYWGYWDYSPGYLYTEYTYRTQTTAFSLQTNKLVWTGLVKSTDPSGAPELVDKTSKIIAQQLTNNGLAG